MNWITKDSLERWAEQTESKAYLPLLLSRLVRATTPLSTFIEFPSGSSVYLGGWDGKVICEEQIGFVPKGISLWEFGTTDKSKAKAEEDYNKRTLNSLGYKIEECTFIFVTPQLFSDKDIWCQEKINEGKWKDVRVYDSRNLEDWLQISPAVSKQLSKELITSNIPFDILSAEEFWKEWAMYEAGKLLPPEIITSGREIESSKLLAYMLNPQGAMAVQASSKNEALAFIIASAMQFEEINRDFFIAKGLITESINSFRHFSNEKQPLILMPNISDKFNPYIALSNNHLVIIPLGADDEYNSNDILRLPTIQRDGMIKALTSLGLTHNRAEQFVKESARNVTILKRFLKINHSKLQWAKAEHCRDIIPALLLGRWDENKPGDRKLLEDFAGEPYDNYINKLIKWRDFEVPAVLQIGETWRLASPMDAWSSLAAFITKRDLENLAKAFDNAFKNGNPVIDNELQISSPFFQRETFYSNWSREGLVQSLILIGFYGERFKIPSLTPPQLWVDKLVSELLHDASSEMWISLERELPLIAEASPDSFLKALENSLALESKPIMKMFEESQGLIMAKSHQSSLLWAIEAIAWLPEYLLKTTSLLCRLAALDPGGQLNNRPINSLSEIFKPWHYQTFTTFPERMQVLKHLTKVNTEIAWDLLIKLLPDSLGGIAMPTNKMRWRLFDYSKENQYTNHEFWDTNTAVIDLLLHIFDFSESKLSILIKESANKQLGIENQKKVLSFIEKVAVNVIQVDYTAWHSIRKLLAHHRSHPNTEWALSEVELLRYEKVYFQIQPQDEIEQELWLFNEQWPSFPEGFNYKNDVGDNQQDAINGKRKIFLKKVFEKYGLKKIKELVHTVKELWIFGEMLGDIVEKKEDVLSLCELLNETSPIINFMFGFIQRKSYLAGFDWFINLFHELETNGFNDMALTNLLIPIEQNTKLWHFIDGRKVEIQSLYWSNVDPYFFRLNETELAVGFNYLIKHKRYLAALHICSLSIEKKLPTSLIADILYKAATEKTDEKVQLRDYDVERIFKELDKRIDIEESLFINLEMLYLNYLASYGSTRLPNRLHNAITNNPSFFVELLTYLYKPDNDELIEKDELTNNQKARRAHKVYELLNSWEKIPGVDESGIIDKSILDEWVKNVLSEAELANRKKGAEIEIGRILAQYPETSAENWPPIEICEIIETINTETIKNNFRSAIFNKRGTYSKGAFEGGQQERALSAKFHQFSLNIINEFPNVADILESLAKSYEYNAKEEDKRAKREALEY